MNLNYFDMHLFSIVISIFSFPNTNDSKETELFHDKEESKFSWLQWPVSEIKCLNTWSATFLYGVYSPFWVMSKHHLIKFKLSQPEADIS